MTSPDQTSEPDTNDADPGPDNLPGRDEPEIDGTTPTNGSPTRPDGAGDSEELRAVQEAALGSSSQESLLRLLGWRPGDPLPDDGDVPPAGDADDEPDGTDLSTAQPAPDPWAREAVPDVTGGASDPGLLPEAEAEPVVPVNWNTLDADRAEQEWWQLDGFVYWLRDDFGLTPQELPPLWHRHTELVWELSALRTAWLAAHTEDAHPGSPLMWLRDLGDSRRRLRDWVQRCGTTLTEDRPTRRTTWPGEEASKSPAPVAVTDRAADFAVFVTDDVARRRQIEVQAQAEIEQARARRIERLREAWHLPGTHSDDTGQDGDQQEPDTTEQEGTS
ncbi:hypothetical protein C8K30_115113 [Promicromonospora sp. AC04]|uniref:hypothetical protein n=1 Tax=Promicromonospora sp. AC04 TaxID=2135723 RepID=UPI000D3D5776|nr:hypothetical protein [Promicromonospora sp. AC04]PUB20902.1 hypothetical protein C8K30_115113 [Promicromonospora sp. AC04]